MVLLIQQVIDPALSAEEKKLSFVSIWFSFAFALFLLNRCKKNWLNNFRQREEAPHVWLDPCLWSLASNDLDPRRPGSLVGWLSFELAGWFLTTWLSHELTSISITLNCESNISRLVGSSVLSLAVASTSAPSLSSLSCSGGTLKDQPVLWQGERESVNTNINPSNGNQRLLL